MLVACMHATALNMDFAVFHCRHLLQCPLRECTCAVQGQRADQAEQMAEQKMHEYEQKKTIAEQADAYKKVHPTLSGQCVLQHCSNASGSACLAALQ